MFCIRCVTLHCSHLFFHVRNFTNDRRIIRAGRCKNLNKCIPERYILRNFVSRFLFVWIITRDIVVQQRLLSSMHEKFSKKRSAKKKKISIIKRRRMQKPFHDILLSSHIFLFSRSSSLKY